MNHSCAPNAVIAFNHRTLNLHALETINSGFEIAINYVSIANVKSLRHQELRETWFFDCKCVKCSSSLEPDLCLETQRRRYERLKATWDANVSNNDNAESPHNQLLFLKLRQDILDELSWPKEYEPRIQVLHEQLMTAIDAGKWIFAVRYALERYMDYDPLVMPQRQPWHLVRVINSFVLLKLIAAMARVFFPSTDNELGTGIIDFENPQLPPERMFSEKQTTTTTDTKPNLDHRQYHQMRQATATLHTANIHWRLMCQNLLTQICHHCSKTPGRDSTLFEEIQRFCAESGIFFTGSRHSSEEEEKVVDEGLLEAELRKLKAVVEPLTVLVENGKDIPY